MLTINYYAKALQPIHHGSDEKFGIVKLLKREKRRIKFPIKHTSQFTSEQERREAVLVILICVYKSIDKELKKENYGFYDAYASKILAATRVRTRHEFLTELCKSCEVRTISTKEYTDADLLKIIDRFSDEELLDTIRTEHQYLMLMLRNKVQGGDSPTLFTASSDLPDNIIFEKYFEWIPFISGNAVRGLMRRLVMNDFFKRIGVDKKTYGVKKNIYYQLTTGGNITSSTEYEDIELREKYISLCPMIGLFGSAIGNMTIQSKMKVSGLRPTCREHGNDAISYWETIGIDFATRLDTAKTEREIYIIPEEGKKKDKSAMQMMYYQEVFNLGTVFDGEFALVSDDEILVSALYFALKLWKEYGYIAGMSAKGFGKLHIEIDIPEGAERPYLDYVEKNKKKALAFFAVAREIPLNDVLA